MGRFNQSLGQDDHMGLDGDLTPFSPSNMPFLIALTVEMMTTVVYNARHSPVY